MQNGTHKLMIVAHPSEETLFGGATLASQPNQWKVICVTNGDNWIRRREFETVMQMSKSDFEIWDYPDNQFDSFNEDCLRKSICRVIYEKFWSVILTHQENSEHLHQQQIHNTVKSIVCNARVFQFGDQMKDSLWTPKLTLIQQYTSQANTCLRLALIARSEIID